MKDLEFLGDSLQQLKSFPIGARREAGFQLDQVQNGNDPDDWKPLSTIGPGVREIRIWDETGTFRVIYIATFLDAVFVLHVFQKKSQATSKRDIDVAKLRLKQLKKRIAANDS